MDSKRWLPLAAVSLVGSHLIARRARLMRERMGARGPQAAVSTDVANGLSGPSPLWSSAYTCVIHIIEESTMAMLMALFVAGGIGVLAGL